MEMAVIGAGFTGLTAAYELAKRGHRVEVFEKNNFTGGLAGGVRRVLDDYPKEWDWDLDGFYRHLFVSDTEIINLIKEVGLGKRLFFRPAKTSLIAREGIFPFDTAMAIITFPGLTWFGKLRAGLVIFWLRYLANWRHLEQFPAHRQARLYFGEEVYHKLWRPLLKKKFKSFYQEVNLAWLWARFRKRSRKLGYLEGSFQVLIDRLGREISQRGGKIRTNCSVSGIKAVPKGLKIECGLKREFVFDKVVATVAPSAFLRICPELPADYQKKLGNLRSLGASSLILVLRRPLMVDGTYWLNVNRQDIPFLSLVEQTNFQDKSKYGGCSIVYIGNYFDEDSSEQNKDADELVQEYLPFLKQINPEFKRTWILRSWLFSRHFAQPVFSLGYSKLIPPIKTPLKDLYYASMCQVYPWDRGMNYAVEMGKRVAELMLESCS